MRRKKKSNCIEMKKVVFFVCFVFLKKGNNTYVSQDEAKINMEAEVGIRIDRIKKEEFVVVGEVHCDVGMKLSFEAVSKRN